MLALTLKQFNDLPVDAQVAYVNKALGKLGSLRKVASDLQINKSTIQSRFKRAGYVLQNNTYNLIKEDKSVELKVVPTSGKSDAISEKDVDTILDSNSLIPLSHLENEIRKGFRTIAVSFIDIGTKLAYIRDNKLYKDVGFKNIIDYAFSAFGINKNGVYSFIGISEKFTDGGVLLDKYKSFNYSQLVEMLSIPSDKLDTIKPTDTVKVIRKKKSAIKSEPKQKQKQIQGQTAVEDFVEVTTSKIRLTVDVSKYQQPLIDAIYALDDIQKEHNKDAKLLGKIMNVKSILQDSVRQLNNLNK